MSSHPSLQSFSLAASRRTVSDLFIANPLIYWVDFGASWALGLAAFGAVRRVDPWAIKALFFVSAGLLLYRAASFIHEIVHLRANSFRLFRVAWNLLCGIPFLVPSFTYYSHLDHHRRRLYGTGADGEYLPLANGPRWAIVYYLSQSLIVPLLVVARFAILTPLAWASPAVRGWVHRRASSLVMDPNYIRPAPTPELLAVWRLQEAACFAVCVGGAVAVVRQWASPAEFPIPLLAGKLPIATVVQMYLTAVFVVLLNEIRTLGAHRYRNDGRELTFVEQLTDSVNYPSWPLVTELWAPVGLAYHALHHLFPSLPYHNLRAAHHRLMQALPPDSPYRLTVSPGLLSTIGELWRSAEQAGATAGASMPRSASPADPAQA